MINFIRYLPFYYRLTERKMPIIMVVTFMTIAFQGMAGAAFLPVFELGTGLTGTNPVTKTVFEILSYLQIASDNQKLAILLSFATLCFTLSSFGLVATEAYMARLQANILHSVQTGITRKLFNANFNYFSSKNIGFLNNVISNFTGSVTYSFKFYSNVMINVIFAVFYAIFATIIDFKLSIIMFMAGIPLFYIIRVISEKNKEYSIENATVASSFNNIVIQILTYFKYFKATNTSERIENQVDVFSRRVGHTIKKLAIWGTIGQRSVTPVAVAIICMIVYYKFSVEKQTLSQVIAVLVCLYVSYQKIIVVPTSYQKFLGSTGPIQEFLKFDSELDKNKEGFKGDKTPDFDGPIRFQNLSFTYADAENKVLDGINIEISPKTSVAFVGESGAGKSTAVNLLTGLFLPSSGEITLSGIQYSEINFPLLRKNISYVTQEPVIFNDTVKNNLTLWDDKIAREDVFKASTQAHAHDFISKMDSGYDTLLGSNGVNISGGQRQRISIARELLRDTRILIMDEATSALDTETEQTIQENLKEIHGTKTIIIIAHRLSTIRHCDKIFVLDKGRIVEQGSFEQLFKKEGKFREMVQRQSL